MKTLFRLMVVPGILITAVSCGTNADTQSAADVHTVTATQSITVVTTVKTVTETVHFWPASPTPPGASN